MRWGNAQSLENSALYYLERYAATTESLRRVMLRKMRRAAGDAYDQAKAQAMLAALVAKLQAQGLLNDRAFASAKAASLHARGGSKRMVALKLRQKGVAAEVIADVAPNDDAAAAVTYARRRKLGRFRAQAPSREQLQKDLAAMGRAGFSYAVAKAALAPV